MSSQAEADKLATIERQQGYQTMMSTPQSRRVMWERFEIWAIYQAAKSTEPSAMAWHEGKRCGALEVMHDLLAFVPELYDLMVRENRERLLREARKRTELESTE